MRTCLGCLGDDNGIDLPGPADGGYEVVSDDAGVISNYPTVGVHKLVGPDIDVSGQGYTLTTPFTQPGYNPEYYHGPWITDLTRGRHPFRTLPRKLGVEGALQQGYQKYPWFDARRLASPSLLPVPVVAHGVGQETDDGTGPTLRVALVGVALVYGLWVLFGRRD